MRDRLERQSKFEPAYLNRRRLATLVGEEAYLVGLSAVKPHWNEKGQRYNEFIALGALFKAWMVVAQKHLEPFEVCHLQGLLEPGRFFYVDSDFYCRGLGNRVRSFKGQAMLHRTFPQLATGSDEPVCLELLCHNDHLAPGSAGDVLQGRIDTTFALAQAERVSPTKVVARPIAIGHWLKCFDGLTMRVPGYNKVDVSRIDSFSAAALEPKPSKRSDLEVLRTISEQEIKFAFAEIIGEPERPKDWGGETSDLYSTRVIHHGRPISTAFAFKGPAKFGPMKISTLGKNGDQLLRLRTEDAELLVLQHCHHITAPVHRFMKAVANQIGDPRLYCVIDGYDTLRVLRAYGKCGQSSRRSGDETSG